MLSGVLFNAMLNVHYVVYRYAEYRSAKTS
jgi:hypothetical protein